MSGNNKPAELCFAKMLLIGHFIQVSTYLELDTLADIAWQQEVYQEKRQRANRHLAETTKAGSEISILPTSRQSAELDDSKKQRCRAINLIRPTGSIDSEMEESPLLGEILLLHFSVQMPLVNKHNDEEAKWLFIAPHEATWLDGLSFTLLIAMGPEDNKSVMCVFMCAEQ